MIRSEPAKRARKAARSIPSTAGSSRSPTPTRASAETGGNFANDPDKASEAGRKGGQHSHGGSTK